MDNWFFRWFKNVFTKGPVVADLWKCPVDGCRFAAREADLVYLQALAKAHTLRHHN